MPLTTLTHTELEALHARYNIADGHAHQSLNERQEGVVARLPSIYAEVRESDIDTIEQGFLHAFFRQQGQSWHGLPNPHLLYSASIAIHVAARVLSEQGRVVGLVTPTFDNLPDLLRAQRVAVVAFDEDAVLSPANWDAAGITALFLVLPNNPTGWRLDADEWRALIADVTARDILLVVDFSFRYFDADLVDVYALLQTSGCQFIAIEDTGKHASALDIKVGIAVADTSTNIHVTRVVEDILLNVSPLALGFLRELIENDSREQTLELIKRNRRHLCTLAPQLGLMCTTRLPSMSVEWLWTESSKDLKSLVNQGRDAGVVVLPGEPFFWNDHKRGRNFIRIALMRDHGYFRRSLEALMTNVYQELGVENGHDPHTRIEGIRPRVPSGTRTQS
jgi:aspartate/methionine/tyrosine aminotransferase